MNSRPRKKAVAKRVPGFARAAIAAVLMVGVGAACTDSTGPRVGLTIMPATGSVSLRTTPQGQALITSLTLTNTSRHPVVWSSCGLSLEKAGLPALPPGKGGWDTVWQPFCYALVNAPISLLGSSLGGPILHPGEPILHPGESITIPVSVPVGVSLGSTFTGVPGAYRFHFSLAAQILDRYVQLPYESSVSDSFTLLPAP